MSRLLALPLAIAALLAPVTLARAEILGGVGSEPVKLQADQLDIDILAGEATLTGKVTLTKGDLVVNCPRIELRFEHAPQAHVGPRLGRGHGRRPRRSRRGPVGRARPHQAGARPARRREADAGTRVAHGRQRAHRDRDRQGLAHAGEGGHPGRQGAVAWPTGKARRSPRPLPRRRRPIPRSSLAGCALRAAARTSCAGSTSKRAPARCSACWGRRGPASRRCSGRSWGRIRPTRAPSPSRARTSPAGRCGAARERASATCRKAPACCGT